MNPFRPIPRSFLATLLVVAGANARAADLYWDADADSSAGTGGTGPWNLSDSFWRDSSSTGTLGIWTPGSTANLGGTYGTLTVPASTAIANAPRAWASDRSSGCCARAGCTGCR